MGHALGCAPQGRFNDPVSLALIIVRFAPATGSDLPDLPDALLVHPLAPKLHGGSAHAEPLGNGHILLTRHRFQDNPATQAPLVEAFRVRIPTVPVECAQLAATRSPRPALGMPRAYQAPRLSTAIYGTSH